MVRRFLDSSVLQFTQPPYFYFRVESFDITSTFTPPSFTHFFHLSMFFPLHFIFVLRTVPQNTYTHIHLQLQCGNKTVCVTHLSFNMEGENLVKERDRAIERKIARYYGKKSWCSRVDKQDGTIKPFSLQKSKIKNISTSTNTCVVLVLKFRTNTSNKHAD